jgi:hypothetical protein
VLRAAPGGGPTVAGPLHTSGNRILDANGAPVVLRGVNFFGLEAGSSPTFLAQTDAVQAKQWGATMVRIALGQQLWLAGSCDYDPKYQAAVDQMVNWVTSLGMVAMLDLHWLSPGTSCTTGGPRVMADDPGSIQFWQQVAARYAGNPLVVFDLYNEPHDISNSVWLNGGQVTDTSSGIVYQAAGMQALYDAVRSTGATNLVFVSGTNWADTPPTTLVRGSNIVYAVHAYTCSIPWQVPPQCTTANALDPSSILNRWLTLSQSEPVAVTEFGWPTPFDGTYMANVVTYAQHYGWSWSAFAWDGENSSAWTLLAQVPPGGTFQPSPAGMPILAALAGLPLR